MAASTRLAKLSVPRASGALVRPRLHQQLDEAVQRSAVWIAAGPGAGKSTLAAAWAASRRGRVLWFRADEGDADPAAAFGYFRELANAGRRATALPTYTARDLDRLDLFARTFFRAFFAVVSAASTLVIDDAHAVDSDTFATLLVSAVREAPHDVALVILSRHDPAGLLLEQLSNGAIEVVDASALAFTPEEASTLLADRMDERSARRLQTRAGGWVAGMLLLAQGSRTSAADRPEAGERIASYFQECVLAPFDAVALRTLAAVSLLPDVHRADLQRLGAAPSGEDLLETLRKRHAFVTRLDRQPPSWRLHDLLRDALAARFDTIGSASWRLDVMRRAGDIAAERQLAREAVQLRMRAGDVDAARATAERFARALVKAQRLAELDAITAVLGSAIDTSVPLQLALGESAWQRNDARAALARFEPAYTLADTPAPSPLRLLVAASALTAILEGWQDYDGTQQWLERLHEHLPARAAIEDASDACASIARVCGR